MIDKNLVYFLLFYGGCWKTQCYFTQHHLLPILARLFKTKHKLLISDKNQSIMFANRLFSLTHSILSIYLTRYALNKHKKNNDDIDNSFIEKDFKYPIDRMVANNSIAYTIIDSFVYVLKYEPNARMASLLHHIIGTVSCSLCKNSKYWCMSIEYILQWVERSTVILCINWMIGYLIKHLKLLNELNELNLKRNGIGKNTRLLRWIKVLQKIQTFLSLSFAISFFYIRMYVVPKHSAKCLKKYVKNRNKMNVNWKEKIQIYILLVLEGLLVSLGMFWSVKLMKIMTKILTQARN